MFACLAASCVGKGDGFRCKTDSECSFEDQQGQCQATGYCSFYDLTCDSYQRYGEYAGPFSRECADAVPVACGDTSDSCCTTDNPCDLGANGTCDCSGGCTWDSTDCLGDLCVASEQTLHCNVPLMGDNTEGDSTIQSYDQCRLYTDQAGPEAAYSLPVAEAGDMVVTLTPSAKADLSLAIMACEDTCVDASDSGWNGKPETITFEASAQSYLVIVDSFTSAGGPFTLEACCPGLSGLEICDGLDNDCNGMIDDGVSGAWGVTTIDASDDNVGRDSSLAIDKLGDLHVSYYDATNGDLKYATRPPGSNWTTEAVDTLGDLGQRTSIAVGSKGDVHISYWATPALKYANKPLGGEWAFELVDTSGVGGEATSIALNGAGLPRVVYGGPMGDELRYAEKHDTAGKWNQTVILTAPSAGDHPSIDLDANDTVHVSFQISPDGGGDLVYARRGEKDVSFTTESPHFKGNVGTYTSIAVDESGAVHISYRDVTNADLRYAYRAAGGSEWTLELADPDGTVGTYTSLALGASGAVHVSYYDVGNTALKYAYRLSGTWTREIVDDAGDVGKFTSLALDQAGHVHITYYDESNGNLKHAYRCF